MRLNNQLLRQAGSAKRRSLGFGERADVPAAVAATSAARLPSLRATVPGRRANLAAAVAAGAGARKVERMPGASVTRMSNPLLGPGVARGGWGSATGAAAKLGGGLAWASLLVRAGCRAL